MSAPFDHMLAVRTAFDALGGGGAAARAAFLAAHAAHRDAYVVSFELAGATYPRTDGHRLSESQARQAIDKALSEGAAPEDLKPGVLRAAYPLPTEVLRHEIEQTVRAAAAIATLDWKTDRVAAADAAKVRDLLRMPTNTGSYAALRKLADARPPGQGRPYRGYSADHLITDKALRGVATVRKGSPTKASSFATFLQDGQNKGSQHKFATDAQNLVRAEFALLGRNPTVDEYLQRAFIWMQRIYTRADLVVDGALRDNDMIDGDDFRRFLVKGYAVSQAGFMTWAERETVGRAIATALLIEARDHYAAIGWPLARELPLIGGTTRRRRARAPSPPSSGNP